MLFCKNTLDIRHFVTSKTSWVIYLMECCPCTNSQSNGKSECNINLRIKTHGNDVWRVDDKYFQNLDHKFNEWTKFLINRKINDT